MRIAAALALTVTLSGCSAATDTSGQTSSDGTSGDASTSTSCTSGACSETTTSYYICDGDSMVACSGTDVAWTYDCTNDGGTCYDYGGDFGADCVVPLGAECVVCLDPPCFDWYAVGCGDSAPNPAYGCGYYTGCTALSAGCTPSTSFVPYCDGTFLVLDCIDYTNVDFPFGVDCADGDSLGGSCNSGGYCEVGVDLPCDDDIVRCGAGLTCVDDGFGGGICAAS